MRTPQEFTTNDATASELNDADEGLILYGVAKAWQAIGDEARYDIWMRKFTNPNPPPTQDIGWIERYKDRYAAMEAWEGTLFTPVNNYVIAGN